VRQAEALLRLQDRARAGADSAAARVWVGAAEGRRGGPVPGVGSSVKI
jgi:hypothetical protein